MEANKKTVVITGGGSGIGRAMACKFFEKGYFVFVLDLSLDSAKGTLDQFEHNAGMAIQCDVSSKESIENATKIILKSTEVINAWINNAGISHIGNVLNTSEEDLDRLYQVNIKGVYFGMQSALEKMLEQGYGVILNMASIASKLGIDDRFAYSMTKGAVHSMSLSVAKDYVNKGIRCNTICPARIHTPFVDGFIEKNYPDNKEEVFENLSKYQPIGRMGQPSEVANLAYFLCSDEASFITGSSYDIDGGVTQLR